MLVLRNANENDNKLKILQLIYSTDEYIYPVMMPKNLNEYEYIFQGNGIYSFENIILALKNEEIVGLIISFDKTTNLTDIQNEQLMSHYIELMNSLDDDTEYINNVCVLPEYRNIGVASKLITYVEENTKKSKLILDCLLKNHDAINLYKKLRFLITEIDTAFCLDPSQDIKVIRMEKILSLDERIIDKFIK